MAMRQRQGRRERGMEPTDCSNFLKNIICFHILCSRANCNLWDVKGPGYGCTLICLTPQLTSLLGWYKSHDMSNICGEKTYNALNILSLLHNHHNIIYALCSILFFNVPIYCDVQPFKFYSNLIKSLDFLQKV